MYSSDILRVPIIQVHLAQSIIDGSCTFMVSQTFSLCLSQMQTICIDSVTMTVRFDPISAKSFCIEPQVLLGNMYLDFHCIRPIFGKLN